MSIRLLGLFFIFGVMVGQAAPSLPDSPPVNITRINPAYPLNLKKANISGEVIAEFVIDGDGSVKNARIVSSSHSDFEPSVLAAVLQWKYHPGIKKGKPVAVRVRQALYFDPKDEVPPVEK